MTNQEQVEKYLDIVFNGMDGQVNLWRKSHPGHISFTRDAISVAAAAILDQSSKGTDIYVRSNVQPQDGGTAVATVAAFTMVSIDFDLKGPGHAEKNLPTDKEDFWRYLDRGGIPHPTVTLLTGGGIQAVWRLESPLVIASKDDRQRASSLSKCIQTRVGGLMRDDNFKLDSTGDLVRSCRIPSTRNWKPAYGPGGADVTILDWSDRPITMSELEGIATKVEEVMRRPRSPTVRRDGHSNNARASSTPSDANSYAVLAGCDALRAWSEASNGLPEPQWFALACVLGFCHDGPETFHTISQLDVRYSVDETEKKIRHAAQDCKPRSCANIEGAGGNCSACPFKGKITTPLQLGYTTPATNTLAREWVFISTTNSFVKLTELEK